MASPLTGTQSSFHFSPLQVCQKAKFMIINLCLLTNNRSTGKTPKQLPINNAIVFSLEEERMTQSSAVCLVFFHIVLGLPLESEQKKKYTRVVRQA